MQVKPNAEHAYGKQKEIMSMKSSKENIVNRNRILTELKTAQTQGKLQGILGRLGDLGTIEE